MRVRWLSFRSVLRRRMELSKMTASQGFEGRSTRRELGFQIRLAAGFVNMAATESS
jgi:hypothetical protein